ncbi:MAG: DUF4055 domain-containing protein [Marinomonas gallaica]
MGIDTVHPEYKTALPIVKMTRDAAKGDAAIKAGGTTYLPAEFAETDKARYAAYKNRSFFLGATKQAQKSTIGMIFRSAPDIGEELPTYLAGIAENIDGGGQSIEQIAKYSIREMEETGRVCFLADYPPLDPALTRSEEGQFGARPMLVTYAFESVINWKTTIINGSEKLSLVVLCEEVESPDAGEFDHDHVKQFRILRLRDGVYTQEVVDEEENVIVEEFAPLMAGGVAFDYIPFYIAGTENNKPDVDPPLLSDLAIINIAHYQTTADHRENLYIHGQMTLGVSTKMDWVEFQAANPNGVKVGARDGHYLGEGGSFHSVTAPESSSLRIALQDLEDQMISIGAKLITKSGQAETAEATRIKTSGEVSALDTMVNNLSDALENVLEDMLLFAGFPDVVTYRLNTQFYEDSLSPQMAAAITGFETASVISKRDARYMIRRGKIEIEEGRTDEEIEQDIALQLVDDDIV